MRGVPTFVGLRVPLATSMTSRTVADVTYEARCHPPTATPASMSTLTEIESVTTTLRVIPGRTIAWILHKCRTRRACDRVSDTTSVARACEHDVGLGHANYANNTCRVIRRRLTRARPGKNSRATGRLQARIAEPSRARQQHMPRHLAHPRDRRRRKHKPLDSSQPAKRHNAGTQQC